MADRLGIVFVNPPLSLRERYGDLAEVGTKTPPLGLCHLAAVVRKEGFPTRIVDAPSLELDYQDTVEEILSSGPCYVGITATVISIDKAGELARRLKQREKALTVIIGGPQLTAMPVETLGTFPDFNVAVVGEGELTIVELLSALEEKRDLSQVRGLALRDNGRIKLTPRREFIKDLDELPMPAWDLLPPLAENYQPAVFNTRQRPAFSLITSRGCPGKCTFCDRAVFGNLLRAHSAPYVVEMMNILHSRYGIKEFAIADDNFVIFKKRLRQICQHLINSSLRISWSCNARVDHLDEKLLPLMRESGCWQMGFGIESGSQEVLDVIQKGVTLRQIEEAVKLARRFGIRTKGFFMMGNPRETEETMRQTIEFALRIGLNDFQLTYFTPLPGSQIYREAERYGTFVRDLPRMNYWQPLFIPRDLSREQLERYYRLAYRKFYYRLKVVISYLGMVRSLGHIKKLIQGLLGMSKMIFRGKQGTEDRGQKTENRKKSDI